MRFVGVDLAWKEAPGRYRTAIAVLDSGGRPHSVQWADMDDEVIDSILEAGRPAIVGVDAPLVVPNNSGCRPCERALQARGVSIYPANRSYFARRFGGCRGERIRGSLEKEGYTFAHEPGRVPGGGHDIVTEVYPYTFWRTVFPVVPRYKRGRKAQKATAVKEVREALVGLMPEPVPPNVQEGLGPEDLSDATHKRLNMIGDALDALAAALTMWDIFKAPDVDARGVQTFGTREEGFILASWPPLISRPARERSDKDRQ